MVVNANEKIPHNWRSGTVTETMVMIRAACWRQQSGGDDEGVWAKV